MRPSLLRLILLDAVLVVVLLALILLPGRFDASGDGADPSAPAVAEWAAEAEAPALGVETGDNDGTGFGWLIAISLVAVVAITAGCAALRISARRT
jgi:hypothetical protein